MALFCHASKVTQIESALSSARIGSYLSLVGGTALDAAIGAYVWGLELNSALTPVLSMVEVVLRNNLHLAASQQFGKTDWYLDVLKKCGDSAWLTTVTAKPFLAQQCYRKGVPPNDKKSIWVAGVKKQLKHWRSAPEGKLDDVLKRLTADGKPHTPDQVVAHAMFGFWFDLFDIAFESTTNSHALWPVCQAKVFPCDPAMDRATARATLERIKRIRNRISHHEPAWRIATPLTPAGVHTSVGSLVDEMREMLDAMSPEISNLLEASGTFGRLRWLIDPQTLAAFAGNGAPTKVDLRALTHNVRKLASAARRAGAATPTPQPGRALEVALGTRPLLTILPHA